MSMSKFSEYGLLPFCQQLNLIFRKTLIGYNPGVWHSTLPYNRLVVILEDQGESYFLDGEQRLDLTPGCAVLIPAFHEIVHHQSETMRHLSLHFSLEFYCDMELLSRSLPVYMLKRLEWVEDIQRMFTQPSLFNMAATLQSICWQTLGDFARNVDLSVESQLTIYSKYNKLFDFLQRNCRAGVDVPQMAEAAGMTRDTFIRRFTADIGMSPKHFANRLLAVRSARMLAGTKLTIREISLQLGFCNEFYFSRFVKQHLEVSPREYRNRLKLIPREQGMLAPEELMSHLR